MIAILIIGVFIHERDICAKENMLRIKVEKLINFANRQIEINVTDFFLEQTNPHVAYSYFSQITFDEKNLSLLNSHEAKMSSRKSHHS
jgi:hypothetical protein